MKFITASPDGKIVSGRGIGDYVYCYPDVGSIRLKDDKLMQVTLLGHTTWNDSDGNVLWSSPEDAKLYFERNSKKTFTPQTVARVDVLASSSTGPSASNFVKGTLIAGAAVGAAAAMTTMRSEHTVKVTWRDDDGSKESIITFFHGEGFQTFIGQLGSLMNLPNEPIPVPSSPAFSSADEILKFKKLMDEGIITPAEFEAKKKQLLGIENTVINSSEADLAKQNSDNRDKSVREIPEGLSTTNIGGIKVSPEDGAKIIKYLLDHPDDGKMGALWMLKPYGVNLNEGKKAVEACMADIAAIDARKKAAERAEERREAKEEAKQRFDAYWEAHSDERKKLEEEQNALKDQINSLKASLNEQIAALKKEITAIPGKDEIDNLDARIKKLSDDIASLSMFKGKEKKVLQDQIAQAEADKRAVQKRMSAEKAALEAKISEVQRDCQGKISVLQSRNKDINTELNKAR